MWARSWLEAVHAVSCGRRDDAAVLLPTEPRCDMDCARRVTMVPDETAELLMALLVAVRKVLESGAQGKLRIANACVEAHSFIAMIDHDCGSASPRIEAYLKQFNVDKNADDTVALGCMLVAIQTRASELDLDGWRFRQTPENGRRNGHCLILAVVLICLALASQVASFLQPIAISVSTPNHNQAVRSSDHG